ncbi:MAG: hypothetical protein HQL76_14550 [Magnetococcales bacterium]|nr:hypothetical protein [Magnetococcales bacterium]
MEIEEGVSRASKVVRGGDQCPICRAARTAGNVSCRRCGSDLTWILKTEKLGKELIFSALDHCSMGDWEEAARRARRARLVHGTVFSRVLEQFFERGRSIR